MPLLFWRGGRFLRKFSAVGEIGVFSISKDFQEFPTFPNFQKYFGTLAKFGNSWKSLEVIGNPWESLEMEKMGMDSMFPSLFKNSFFPSRRKRVVLPLRPLCCSQGPLFFQMRRRRRPWNTARKEVFVGDGGRQIRKFRVFLSFKNS